MKKLLLFIICVSAFPLVAEELTFVTTMGAKIGSFNRLDTVNPNKTIDFKKLNFGDANISGGSINLKGNASTIGTLTINANKVSSPTVAVYQLASMTVRPDTTLKGKGLLAGTVTSSAKRMELTVGEVLYNTATATVQGAKTPNLKITGKAYITGGGTGADMIWSNKYQPSAGDDKVYLLKGKEPCILSSTYTETPVIGGRNSSGGWEVPEGIPANTCASSGYSLPAFNFSRRHNCRAGEDYACVDSYYQESATENTGYYAEGMNGDVLVLWDYVGVWGTPGTAHDGSPQQCTNSVSGLSRWTPTDFPTNGVIYYFENYHMIRYNSTDEVKEWIDLCDVRVDGDDLVSFDRSGYGYSVGCTGDPSCPSPYQCKRHTIKSIEALHKFCNDLASYREPGIYGLQYQKFYIPSPCPIERSYSRLYMAAIGYCVVEPAREYYTGSVQCCAD